MADSLPHPLPAGAVLRPVELPARADAGPTAQIREYAAVRNASLRQVTGRDDDDLTAEELLPLMFSDDDRVRQYWSIEHGDDVIGCMTASVLADDGGSTGMGTIALLRDHWGRGIGSAVFEHLEGWVRDRGAQRLLSWADHERAGSVDELASPTGFGAVPRDHAARFLQRHGYTLEQVERASALVWDDTTSGHLDALLAETLTHAEGYRVVQWMLPTPDAHIDGYAWMKSRMSTDVPDADLGMPLEVWDADRVRRHDGRYAAMGVTVQVTAAQHIGTGELCAFNELAIGADPTRPTDQQDTLVLAEHRGHRLGMLVKLAGLQSWRLQHPSSPRVITYNAEENRPMLSINESIGFAPVAYNGAWKKVLT